MAEVELQDVRRALVVGLGRSGRAAVEGLSGAGVHVLAVDENADVEPVTFEGDVEVHVGADAIEHLDAVDLLVPSPAIPEHAPLIATAIERRIPIWSEPELGWRLAPRRVVGITGTNGKTSVTELTTQMLTGAGLDAIACGNIGNAFTAAARSSDPEAILVAELSSFQLHFCDRLRVEVGVLLNLEPDHLDWHGSLAAYGAAKARIWRTQREDDWAVVNADDDATLELASEHAPGRIARFSGSGPEFGGRGVGLRGGSLHAVLPGLEGEVVGVADLPLEAPHHRSNVAAAACAALLAGADLEAVGRATRSFQPGRHRLETVAEADGVTFVDDSKATNVGAAVAALRSFSSVVWIAGGLAKGVDLSALASELDGVRHAVVIGEAAGALASLCEGAGVPSERAGDMAEAVSLAATAARPGDTVLLAPACASFDMFVDYADRGEQFAAAARRIARGGAA